MNFSVASKICNNTHTQYPLGAALLYLRGAKQNLYESLSSDDPYLIWIRRKELSAILSRLGKNHEWESTNDCFVTFRLKHNLDMEIDIAITMLSDASSYLSLSLGQAKVL